jgi:hypothetical protein
MLSPRFPLLYVSCSHTLRLCVYSPELYRMSLSLVMVKLVQQKMHN